MVERLVYTEAAVSSNPTLPIDRLIDFDRFRNLVKT